VELKSEADNGNNVTAKKWNMVEGKTTTLEYNNEYYDLRNNGSPKTNVEISISHKKMGRVPSLERWYKENFQPGDEFCLEDFFKVYPNQKRQHSRLVPVISALCNEKKIQQLSPDTFRVLKI